jgi:N-acyl-D-amino-acid deacylase
MIKKGVFKMNRLDKSYDLVFKNLKIIDGTGAPAFYGDIGIKNDTIMDVGKISGQALQEYDCYGLVAAPGFIDIHNHSDFSIFQEPAARNFTSQGVTTLVTGNCGVSGAPLTHKNKEIFEAEWIESSQDKLSHWSHFSDFALDLEKLKKSVNIAPLIGQGNIRGAVMGMENKKASTEQMNQMRQLLRESMEGGCFGMSTGLIYDPGIHSDTEELIELIKIVAEYDGIYATHMRNESDFLIDSVIEAITIARSSGVRTQISHLKTSGKRNFGLDQTVLQLLEYYRRFGVEITCDAYPCIFAHTGLENCFPLWTRTKGMVHFLNILKQKDNREKIKYELSRPSIGWENILLDAGFDETIISGSQKFKEYEGKSINELSVIFKKDPFDTIFYLVANDPGIAVLVGGLGKEDMEYVLQHPLSMICSDARVMKKSQEMCHPRSYRAFTKVLSKYVREDHVLTLEEAIRKMTSFPAWKLGLGDRGLIKPRFKADLVIFDFWNVKYKSEYGDPHHYSEGMVYVLTNGEMVIDKGQFVEEIAGGKLLKKIKH